MSILKKFTSEKEMISEYWRQREERQRQKNLEKLGTLNEQISDIYSDMEEAINKEIASFYAKYAAAEGITLASAKERVSKLDIEKYSRMARKFVEDRDFSNEANEAMRLYNTTMKINRLEMLKSNIGMKMVDGYSDIEKLTDKALTDQAHEEFKRQAGILHTTVNGDIDELAKNIANASFQNATFSDRIWQHQDILRNDLGTLLHQGLIQGVSAAELARRLRKEINTSKYNSQRLLRTELARVQIDAQMESYRRNGYSKYKFLALGAHACEECMRNDGEIFNVEDGRVGENMPPMHPNCMCSTTPVFEKVQISKDVDYMGRRKRESFETPLGDIKNVAVYESDVNSKISTQTYSQSAKKIVSAVDDFMSENSVKVNVVVLKNKTLGGLSAYDHSKNVLYVSEELSNVAEFKKLVGDYFPAENVKDVFTHELLGHKAHWEAIKKYQSSHRSESIEQSKNALEEKLQKYVATQLNQDYNYLRNNVSENASSEYKQEKSLNEVIADAIVLMKKGALKDKTLERLINEVLDYDG